MQQHDRDGTFGAGVVLALVVLTAWIGGLAVELSPMLPADTRAQLTATSVADWCAAATYDAARCTNPTE